MKGTRLTIDVGSRAGTTAVITGGARGFGLAFGRALASRSAQVVLVDLDGDAVRAAAEGIRVSGGAATGIQGDVTDETAMRHVMTRAAEIGGGIELLINNAGLHSDEYNQPMTRLGVAKTGRLFGVNVMGVVTCTLAAQPFMRDRAGANIINISSVAAFIGNNAYGASKLCVAGLTVAFAKELGGDGIRVNAIAPGMVMTETIKSDFSQQMIDMVLHQMQSIPIAGEEQDIVEAMLFLSSPRARFVTGETLRVGAGMGAGV